MNAATATTGTPSETSTGRRVPLVADAPLADPAADRFGFAEFAHALCLLVDDDDTSTPLTIAVSAPWGGGKSSLGHMLETMLERRVRNRGNDDPRLVCWFNAWEHDDAPHLGAALARRWRARPSATGTGGGARSPRSPARCSRPESARARRC